MPIRHGARLASRASAWPRDHFCRSTMLPPRSWPTMWNEFLPISMPITAISLLSFSDMACSFVFGAPCQLGLLEGREHGRTIPFSDIGPSGFVRRTRTHVPLFAVEQSAGCSDSSLTPTKSQRGRLWGASLPESLFGSRLHSITHAVDEEFHHGRQRTVLQRRDSDRPRFNWQVHRQDLETRNIGADPH